MSEKTRKATYIKQSGVRGMAAWTLLLLFLIKMIYMSYKNGMLGMTFYAYASVIFLMIYILFGMSVVPALKKLVYFQMNRGSYRNAAKVYRSISAVMISIAGVSAVVLFFFSTQVSSALFGTPLCSLLMKLMAAALLFWVPMACLRGYMEGIGNAMPGIFAEILAHVTGLVVTILFQPMFAEYGRKVAALVRQDSYAYAYAVCSGGLGLLVGGLAGLLFLLFVRSVFGREIKKRIRADETRKTDSVPDILWNFFSGYITTAFVENIGVLLAIVMILLHGKSAGRAENGAGMLYTGIAVLLLPAGLLAWQISMPFTRQLSAIMKQADFYQAKEKMAFYLKLLSYSVFPYAAALFGLAPLVAEVCFDLQSTEFETFIRIGAGIGCLLCLGIFFRQMASVLLKPYMRNIYAGVLGVSGIIFWFILRRTGMNAETGVAYAYLLACLMYVLLIAFVLLKKIRIYNRLVQSVLCPLVAAVFAAAVGFGVYILLAEKMQVWLLTILCGVLVYLLHNIIVSVLEVFEKHEWNEVPASGFPVSFLKVIGKY